MYEATFNKIGTNQIIAIMYPDSLFLSFFYSTVPPIAAPIAIPMQIDRPISMS